MVCALLNGRVLPLGSCGEEPTVFVQLQFVDELLFLQLAGKKETKLSYFTQSSLYSIFFEFVFW